MAKYLVTGGAGFIGSNIVYELLARGENVRVLDNFSTGKRENIFPILDKIDLIEGDIRSYHIVRDAVEGMDYVLHQAALPSVPRSIRDPITTNEVNVEGTLNMLDAAKNAKVKRFVYASSSSVYGDSPVLPKQEEMLSNPLSPYAVSKLSGEHYCQVFTKVYGLETICLRYFNVFGPRQDPQSQYAAVIPKFVQMILSDKSPTVYGDGEQSRDFTFVANVVDANLKAAVADDEAVGRVFNIACGQRTTINQLVQSINDVLDKNLAAVYHPERLGDVKHSLADITFAKKYLNYIPGVDFETGLRNTIDWYQNL